MSITVVIPTHPARMASGMLEKALKSIWNQSLLPDSVIVQVDRHKQGAAETRHAGLMKVTTDWVAFLDSDDQFLPFHLEELSRTARETKADYVYPWFQCWGGTDPFPETFGQPWDDNRPVATTITVMVRTELAQSVGFLNYNKPHEKPWSGEDHKFTMGCLESGAKIAHAPKRTWIWNRHGGNTAGYSCHGDAA